MMHLGPMWSSVAEVAADIEKENSATPSVTNIAFSHRKQTAQVLCT